MSYRYKQTGLVIVKIIGYTFQRVLHMKLAHLTGPKISLGACYVTKYEIKTFQSVSENYFRINLTTESLFDNAVEGI